MVSYEFVSVESMTLRREKRFYKLSLVQQPKHSRMCGFGEKVDRRPVDPPPVVKLEVLDSSQEIPICNPYYFMYATLMSATSDVELHMLRDAKTRSTTGSSVSSLYRLKDNFNKAGFFFVFPDLSIRMEGTYRLKFSLFEIINTDIYYCDSICSDPFDVFTAKKFPGMEESTPLSRIFAEQGLKIRIRKDSRSKKYRSGDVLSKRLREDSDGSNSDISDDIISEKGSVSNKRPKNNSVGHVDIQYQGNSGSGKAMPVNAPPVNYGYYPQDVYAQGVRPPYPVYGYPRPMYPRDKIHSRREGPSPLENNPRHQHPMNVHAYPMMYSFPPRYPYDPYAMRQYDAMMGRPYNPGYNPHGYTLPARKTSNASDNNSNSEYNSSAKVEPESSSSNVESNSTMPVKSNVQSSDNPNVAAPFVSDSTALRSFYEPSSAHPKNPTNNLTPYQEYGNSQLYYYHPGPYGYPPIDPAYGKRLHAPPPHYTYPVSMNQGVPMMMHQSAGPPPVGYYGQQFAAPYPPASSPASAGGPSSSGNDQPQGISYPPPYAYPPGGTPYPPSGMYAPGVSPVNYHPGMPLHPKRGYILRGPSNNPGSQTTDVVRSGTAGSPMVQSGVNQTPYQPHMANYPPHTAPAIDPFSATVPLDDSTPSQKVKSNLRSNQSQFISASTVNLPPINISTQGSTPIKYEESTNSSNTGEQVGEPSSKTQTIAKN